MSNVHLIILSAIQGVTEFIPVSSSGHLIVLPFIMDWPDQGQDVDVALHLGTLAAVVFYFRKEIWEMIKGMYNYTLSGFKSKMLTPYTYLAISVVIATIPAVIIGFTLKSLLKIDLRYILLIAINSIIFGGFMYWADKRGQQKRSLLDISFKSATYVGIAQSLALIPGVSRSGICLTAARQLGFDRRTSATFAFMLSIPVIIGGTVLSAKSLFDNGTAITVSQWVMLLTVSFGIGLATIKIFMRILFNYSLAAFAGYRVILGFALLGLYLLTNSGT